MSFKISIKTPADINKEAVKFKDSENNDAEVEGDVVIVPAIDSSQVALSSADDISRIINQLQPNCNNMSLETSNVETDLIDEPLPFIPKLIPLQSLSNHVKKDGVAIPLSNPSAPSAIPSAIVLEETVLPNGWKRVVKQRQSGKSAGSTDAYVFTPSGQRLRSRREMERYIEKTGDTSASLDIFKFGRTRGKNFSSTVVVNNSRLDYQYNQNTASSPAQFQLPGAIKEQVNLSANKERSDEISSIIDEDVELNEHLLLQKLNALQGNQINDSQDELNQPEPGYGGSQKRKFEIDLGDFLEVQIE